MGSRRTPPAMVVARVALAPEEGGGGEAEQPPATGNNPAPAPSKPAAAAAAQEPCYTITERMGPRCHADASHEPLLLSAIPSALAAGRYRRRGPQRQRPQELVLRVQLPGVVSELSMDENLVAPA